VRLLGRVDDATLHAWYEGADWFVHPTLYEGSSLVTLEAMAHRRPIIASSAGGLPDKVEPGVNGWLAAPGDVAALSDALDRALRAGSASIAMGDASRRLVEERFAWERVAETMISVYKEVLGAGTLVRNEPSARGF
jgi:glycosyltransferase involved in cell wall biosynthesis